MTFKDLRDFLSVLKKIGEVLEIEVPVEKDWEVGTLCSENFRERGPACHL